MKLKYIIDKEYDKRYASKGNPVDSQHFEEIYEKCHQYLEYTQDQYQKTWDEIGQEFSNYIEKETGYKWFYPTYYCVVSVVNMGISNWGREPKIIRGWKENPYSQRRITAHELVLSHYFEIYKRNYSDYKLSDRQVWALAEIAAFALTSLTETVKTFWPWDFSGYYTNHNYPQIVELQNNLKDEFINRKSFDEYIKRGIELVKLYDQI